MRGDAIPGPGAKGSLAGEMLRTLVSEDAMVDQSTREELQRLLSGGSEPAPAGEAATSPKPAPLDSMEARRRAGMAYVRRLRIYAR